MLFKFAQLSREAFLEIVPIGRYREFLFDSRDPSCNMQPIQTILAFLPKPGAYHPSQSIFAIRQDPQMRVLSSATVPRMACTRLFAYGCRPRTTANASPAALRGLHAPDENLKLMPLARPSMPCFKIATRVTLKTPPR